MKEKNNVLHENSSKNIAGGRTIPVVDKIEFILKNRYKNQRGHYIVSIDQFYQENIFNGCTSMSVLYM